MRVVRQTNLARRDVRRRGALRRHGCGATARSGGSAAFGARVGAVDLTGQWVSIVTEDWRFRMVTPPKGDIPGVNLTPAGAGYRVELGSCRGRGRGRRV